MTAARSGGLAQRVLQESGRRLRSFGFAARGFRLAASGANLRVQGFAAVVVVGLCLGYAVTGAHLAAVVLAISVVLAFEIMNTAVERLCDLVVDLHALGRDDRIRDIKDLAAGAVLVVAVGAAAVGVVVFGPHLV